MWHHKTYLLLCGLWALRRWLCYPGGMWVHGPTRSSHTDRSYAMRSFTWQLFVQRGPCDIGITRELVQTANSWPHPRPTELQRSSGIGTQPSVVFSAFHAKIWCHSVAGLMEWVRKCFIFLSFWKNLRRIGVIILCLIVKPSGSGLFTFGRFWIPDSAFFLVRGLFRFASSSWFSLGRLCVSRHLSISSGLSKLLAYSKVYSTLL